MIAFPGFFWRKENFGNAFMIWVLRAFQAHHGKARIFNWDLVMVFQKGFNRGMVQVVFIMGEGTGNTRFVNETKHHIGLICFLF